MDKALETGIFFYRGPVLWGTWRRARLQGTLRDGCRGLRYGAFLFVEAP
jgi:hypothetical protein